MTARRVPPQPWVALAWTATAVAIACTVGALWLFFATPIDDNYVLWGAVVGLSFPLVGAVIVTRRPGHALGWIFVAIGAGQALAGAVNGYAHYSLTILHDPLPATTVAAWLSGWLWVPTLGLLLVYGLLLFPDGHLPSARWRPVASLGALAIAAATIDFSVSAWMDPYASVYAPEEVGSRLVLVWVLLLFACGVASAASLVTRFHRSRGEERLQLKWVALASAVTVATIAPATLLTQGGSPPLAAVLTLPLVPIAAGVAILKYRLYDIDIVISRTLVFAGLAAFITAIYVAIVVGVGSLLGAGDEPNLALSIVATAVVAVAFQPVRERLTLVANRLVFGKRATPYEVLSRFSSHLGETVATERTLERMARLLADGTGAAHAQVSLSIGGAMVPAAAVGEVDASSEAHVVEVAHQGETLGTLSVTKVRGETLTPADVKLVDDLAAQAGLLLRNVRLTEELKQRIVDLRESRQRLVAAQDAERRRLERDLHDGAQQQIVALKLKLGIARTLAQKEGAPGTVELVKQLAADTDEAMQTLRELAHGIYPPLLAAEGLSAALVTHARKAAVPVVVDADGIGRYGPDVEAAVYFCMLEAVNNAAKYASPAQVTVRLTETDGQLMFAVADDGSGFDPATVTRGHGTTNMTDRIDALGGELVIQSGMGNGTVVRGLVPITASHLGAST